MWEQVKEEFGFAIQTVKLLKMEMSSSMQVQWTNSKQ